MNRVLLSTAQATEKIFGCRSNWKKLAFSMLQKQQKKKSLLKLTGHSELKNFTNTVAKTDIDILKI